MAACPWFMGVASFRAGVPCVMAALGGVMRPSAQIIAEKLGGVNLVPQAGENEEKEQRSCLVLFAPRDPELSFLEQPDWIGGHLRSALPHWHFVAEDHGRWLNPCHDMFNTFRDKAGNCTRDVLAQHAADDWWQSQGLVSRALDCTRGFLLHALQDGITQHSFEEHENKQCSCHEQ